MRCCMLPNLRDDAMDVIAASKAERVEKQQRFNELIEEIKSLGGDNLELNNVVVPTYVIPEQFYETEERKCDGFGHFFVKHGSPLHQFLVENNLIIKHWNPVNPYQHLNFTNRFGDVSIPVETTMAYWRTLH